MDRNRRDDDRDDRKSDRDDRQSGSKKRRQYWQPTAESTRKQMARSKARADSPILGDLFFPKAGENIIRILPPTWPDPDHFCMRVFEHRFVGPDEGSYICLAKMKNERCPICEAHRIADKNGDEDDAKKLQVKTRWVCYVLHRNAEAEDDRVRPKIWDLDVFRDEEIVGRTYDRKNQKPINIADEEAGFDLSFRKTGQGKQTRYVNFEFDRDPSPVHDNPRVMDEILDFIEENPIHKMLKYHDAEYLANMMYGTAERPDEDLDDDDRDDRHARGRDDDRDDRDDRDDDRNDRDEDREDDRQARSSKDEDRDDRNGSGRDRKRESREDDDPDVDTPRQQRRGGGLARRESRSSGRSGRYSD